MTESKFSKRLRDNLKQFGFEFYRIESHSTSPGIPDIHFLHSISGATGWIETKHCISRPKRVPYKPQQAPWLQSYSKAGGRSVTLVYVSRTDEVIVVPGRESISAAAELDRSLGTRTLNLAMEGAWKQVASAVLAA